MIYCHRRFVRFLASSLCVLRILAHRTSNFWGSGFVAICLFIIASIFLALLGPPLYNFIHCLRF